MASIIVKLVYFSYNAHMTKDTSREYSIGEISQTLDIPIDTLRYYEKSGICPFISRNENGYRKYSESDKNWLGFVNCLKSTGMPLKKIKQYLEYMDEGNKTIQKRRELIVKHRIKLQEDMAVLQNYLNRINHKVEFYDELIESHKLDKTTD